MWKKAGIVAGVAAAGALALTPLAFADDGGGRGNGAHGQIGGYNVQDSAGQMPIQACNNSFYEGVYGYLADHQSNSDSHDGDCHQENSASDDSGSN